jgi:TIR domain/Pentapeptide repeats (8 copies)
MAVQEHVERLRLSVEWWNQWRQRVPNLRPDLSGITLKGANLSRADLNNVNLSRAILIGSSLSRANLTATDFSEANLTSTYFIGSTLIGTVLSNANLAETHFSSTTFAEIDLNSAKGLETAIHHGSSIVDINSVTLPLDEHTRKEFLRGVGFSDTFIDYLPSLLNTPIQYHSLFLSHSHHNQTFAKRLHADLQNQGVRCWFAPHDLRPGTSIVRGIEEAIHLHEKLLLILSHHAVNSPWVQQEIETALYKEVTTGQEMLFPIRLDNTVLSSNTLWAKRLCQRHIGDFTGWQDGDAYDQTFTALLRHLKVDKTPTV